MKIQKVLQALSDPRRRDILQLLKSQTLSAGEIYQKFNVSEASISRHLSILKEADLVVDQRRGKYIFYSFNTTVLEEVMIWISSLKKE